MVNLTSLSILSFHEVFSPIVFTFGVLNRKGWWVGGFRWFYFGPLPLRCLGLSYTLASGNQGATNLGSNITSNVIHNI